jgi:predicted Zn-dependent peptidase
MTNVDRKTPPTYKTIDHLSFPWPVSLSLQAGIPLFILNQGDTPIIKLTLLTNAGSWDEPQHGVAYLTGQMLLEGTANKNASQIASYIDHYGAHLTISTRPDYSCIELVTLSKHLVPMLDLLAELLSVSTFPTQQLQRLQQLKIQALKVEHEKSHYLAYKYYKEALLGNKHPYGYSLMPADIAAVTRDHLWAYYQEQWFTGCQVLLSGQVEAQHIQLVQHQLASLVPQKATRHAHPLSVQPPSQVHIPKQGSLQTAICIGKLLFPQTHPDYQAMYVVTALLGGYFGSRLMRNIREEKGYTYHIEASLIPLQAATYFLISTEAIQEFAEQTCQEIYREIEILQTQEVGLEELNTLRNYMVGNFLASINDPFSVMERFKAVQLHGLGQDFYHRLYDTIQQITPAQIQQIARTYLSLDSLTEVQVG